MRQAQIFIRRQAVKHIKKQRLTKNIFAAILLGTVLPLITVLAIVLSVISNDGGDEGGQTVTVPEVLLGEARQDGQTLAYPAINVKNQIKYISVENPTAEFGFVLMSGESTHTLYYVDSTGKEVVYYPDICAEDSDFDYSSLFAIETNDGYSRYTLVDYLCLSLQLAFFDERIPISENREEREAQLKEFGFTDGKMSTVSFTFTDELGATVNKAVKIGDTSVTGTGYYFIIYEEGVERPYIYSSLNNYYGYAVASLTEYIKPLLVAEGLTTDSGYGPFLTTGYYQWLNKLHDGNCECTKYDCSCETKCDPENCTHTGDCCKADTVTEGSKVITFTDTVSSSLLSASGEDSTGYRSLEIDIRSYKENLEKRERELMAQAEKLAKYKANYDAEKVAFDVYKAEYDVTYPTLGEGEKVLAERELAEKQEALANTKKKYDDFKILYDGYEEDLEHYKSNCERVIKALSDKTIGDYTSANIIFSTTSYSRLLDFGKKASIEYKYKITSVEAIITDTSEIIADGYSAGSAYDLIKVGYTATADGAAVSESTAYAVIDLRSPVLSAEAEDKLRAAKIGESLNIEFSIAYTKANAVAKNSMYTITEIIDIYDKDGKEVTKITDTSIVGYRYTVTVNGANMGEATYWLDLSEVTDGNDAEIKKALIGLTTGKVDLEFNEHYSYYESFMDYVTYKVAKIDYFITSELVSAFKFQNSSQRDPYYGESLYENLLEDERRLYGLSAGVCETVVKILGGLSDDNATATAAGLTGDSVAAVGLTPEVMKKYGLYAHTVYFELPRGIKAYTPVEEGDTDATLAEKLDDYTFRATLGFNLYISDVDPETNMRYIASDLYDIVTRVPAEDFVFLDYDFESFWARRSIILVDIMHMANVGVEFNMTDIKGSYNFEITQPKNDEDSLGVYVTMSGECTPNKFTEFVTNSKYDKYVHNGGASLKNLYEQMSTASPEEYEKVLPDSLGASSFREVIRAIFYTAYVDMLPAEDKVGVISDDRLIMRMTLELDDSIPNASPYIYVYEYYRVDDRRILVSIHQENESGAAMTETVADFYISTFAFKKIVTSFVGLLNAELLDTDIGYPDDK